MSVWTASGDGILIANLHGKMFERIDVTRNDPQDEDKITGLKLNLSAGVYLGKNFEIVDEAIAFKGQNAFGNSLISTVVGSYQQADTGDFTPAGVCKESGCDGGTSDNASGPRTNNLPICPIVSTNNNGYVTLATGGLFVLDLGKMQLILIHVLYYQSLTETIVSIYV